MIRFTLLKELFNITNIDSMHGVLPKISIYNNEIASFIEDANIKYRISLNYT